MSTSVLVVDSQEFRENEAIMVRGVGAVTKVHLERERRKLAECMIGDGLAPEESYELATKFVLVGVKLALCAYEQKHSASQ
ncbi:hypothetical protein A3H10_02675 [Candidatus Uhrbacteria bacterium RIFCSPLOWO2_12_FULL_46_10]|uniref:Uncharacterized protein n=1 Tax=Candidatus Uhrbacteria bacterium RIFCSPLOWO2_01_FULL_47_25 TaxID=1802402 RepID=A0A1F7UWP0_9BACT|nr:MAG: hypothetical protein UX68_C0011G0009 [Parcubacteria group bacterium GW2011_GWA2_46_9]OGL59050.1 MAG: hypothetical protein A2752_02435 [Candidatus Uhrbacteria bacterium RIFCSPHIGHO2_01_FULL_46_23]OGL68717.1 MAG: hypothetical protein A3D60_02040 [Candidatus Uhrbacteria bacterium RIFCSPHIGHO2_02_FULL_47_29]OGL74743.1 MAG: hypothetical protein A3E96_03325 [Candidatus Uhrbacteria bacterium RIFCSPHIGHO2_12_FULL_46_13]OGL82154.1 MAG: hypothetical protein A2936_01155 [Candidatus Uhrbacteria bac